MLSVTRLCALGCSSWKDGYEVESIISNDPQAYWHDPQTSRSDGVLPHFIQADFPRKIPLHTIEIEFDHKKDESYTPTHLIIQAGDSQDLLVDVVAIDNIPETEDKLIINLSEANESRPVEAFCLRILIIANLSNGKDSRVRGLSIYSFPERDMFFSSIIK